MRAIECPNTRYSGEETTLFLGGGITGCPDWQKEMIQRFKDVNDFCIYNPRRADFDINDPDASSFQISWEWHFLNKCDAVLFWFPYQSVCPITLYELGVWAAKDNKPIFVGAHPAYSRIFDIRKQLSLIREDIKVHDNFEDLVEEVKDWIEKANAPW